MWDQSPLGMALVDSRGALVHVNPSLARWRSLPPEVLVGRPVAEALPGLTWPLPLRVSELAWPGGTVLAMPGATGDQEGTVLAFMAVDELPRLARTLAEADAARDELETVIQASFDEIFITDGEGRVVSVNAACERFYGVAARELQGKYVSELEEQKLFTPSGTAEVIRTRQRRTVVQETRAGRRLVVTSIPVFAADGTLRRVVSVARDVTEVGRLMAQLSETEALAEHYRMELGHLAGKARRGESDPVYASGAMQDVLDMVRRVAPVDAAVLITGESGVGKGHIATLFHRWSPRARGPFLTIDCGALPESLIESELFGYEGGAFTGANKEGRRGLIESADGGTLFLDEVGELPLTLQVKLLRFLQEKTVTRVGGRQARVVDVRVVAATNRDLRAMVAQGRFREDLFWRLNVVPIHMLPLRGRLEDVPALLDHFLAEAALKFRREVTLSPEAKGLLCRYHWPGNVRELENMVVRLVVTAVGTVIRPQDLPPEVVGAPAAQQPAAVAQPAPVPNGAPLQVYALLPLQEARDEVERQLLLLARQRCATTREMAELLGVNQSTVVRKLQKLCPDEPIEG
jgi:PAS domain S-box-containing protein